MGDRKRLPGCTCHDGPGVLDCPVHDDARPLTEFELDALEALTTAPRRLHCCEDWAALGWGSTFEVVQVEVTHMGVVRWWRCTKCSALRVLDSVARPIELTPGATA